jgi:hypothetical protein
MFGRRRNRRAQEETGSSSRIAATLDRHVGVLRQSDVHVKDHGRSRSEKSSSWDR